MANAKLYAVIYVVLFVLATAQVGVEYGFIEDAYWLAFWGIIALSFLKALFVAAYYMHLNEEPRSVTYVAATGLLAALTLTLAAAYSIT